MQFQNPIVVTKQSNSCCRHCHFPLWLLSPHSTTAPQQQCCHCHYLSVYCGYLYSEPSHSITTASEKLAPLHHDAVVIALRLLCLCILLASNVLDCCLYNNIVNSPNTIAVCMLTVCCALADTGDYLLFFSKCNHLLCSNICGHHNAVAIAASVCFWHHCCCCFFANAVILLLHFLIFFILLTSLLRSKSHGNMTVMLPSLCSSNCAACSCCRKKMMLPSTLHHCVPMILLLCQWHCHCCCWLFMATTTGWLLLCKLS